MTTLMTRDELAKLLNVSTRTVDRWRAEGLDLGEFRAHPRALPRFDPEKVRQAIASSRFAKVKRKASKPTAVPNELNAIDEATPRCDRVETSPALAG
jgi:phage terminase Nu1 subunit (DNA packaging protein)